MKRESFSPLAGGGTPKAAQRATHITQQQPAFTEEELKFFAEGELISEGAIERD
jgi:hypothetical protein